MLAARFGRYAGDGRLATWDGDRAPAFLHAHARQAVLGLAVLAVAGIAWIAWRRRKRV
jgi:hypothetical protein